MKTVFTVFERDPRNDYTGLLTGVYTSKDIALTVLTRNCQEGEKWAAEQNAKFPGTAAFTNCYFTVTEDILQDGEPLDAREFFEFHQSKRYFQKFNWDGTQLVPTAGVPILFTADDF